jgi:hypothetical protein
MLQCTPAQHNNKKQKKDPPAITSQVWDHRHVPSLEAVFKFLLPLVFCSYLDK